MRTEFKDALITNRLARGIKAVLRCIERGEAAICFLANDCDEAGYTDLVMAICKQNGVPIIKFPTQKKLGEIAQLCKYDKEGNPRKVVKCSSLVLKELGDQPSSSLLREYAEKNSE